MTKSTTRYDYKVFGISLQSMVPLPALQSENGPNDHSGTGDPLIVMEGTVDMNFESPPTTIKPFTRFNEDEFYYEIPDVGRYFVSHGSNIVIEPLCEDWDRILLFFYSNCLAASLFQRNLIPLHVSGILDVSNKAWLIAGTSKAGKSTTALMLAKLGYKIFTDDTALLQLSDNGVHAVSSYPMIKVWQKTLEAIDVDSTDVAFQIRPDIWKYGIHFHEEFESEAVHVAGIIFLDNISEIIQIEKMKPIAAFEQLRANIYRKQWIDGMNMEKTVFGHLSQVVKKVSLWSAKRPKNEPSFESFATAIHDQILSDSGR